MAEYALTLGRLSIHCVILVWSETSTKQISRCALRKEPVLDQIDGTSGPQANYQLSVRIPYPQHANHVCQCPVFVYEQTARLQLNGVVAETKMQVLTGDASVVVLYSVTDLAAMQCD